MGFFERHAIRIYEQLNIVAFFALKEFVFTDLLQMHQMFAGMIEAGWISPSVFYEQVVCSAVFKKRGSYGELSVQVLSEYRFAHRFINSSEFGIKSSFVENNFLDYRTLFYIVV